jgi:hypothetical protein
MNQKVADFSDEIMRKIEDEPEAARAIARLLHSGGGA